MNKVLIIAAHPDDDILGCGGYMSKFSQKMKFRVIFIAEGSSCRYTKDKLTSKNVKDVILERNNFGINALKILGIDNYKFYDFQCGRLDQVPIIDLNKIIETEIKNFKPDIVFTHSNSDTNNDHKIVHDSTLIATRPPTAKSVKEVYSYEVLSSSEWKFTKVFIPNYFVKISFNDLKRKWDALAEYKTEVKKFPYPRSFEGIECLARYRGMQSNSIYAEAFKLIRKFD
tara:strand:- start:207 stop:890 length:684 start_codon:yes stop_codon:yes gene_type:complete